MSIIETKEKHIAVKEVREKTNVAKRKFTFSHKQARQPSFFFIVYNKGNNIYSPLSLKKHKIQQIAEINISFFILTSRTLVKSTRFCCPFMYTIATDER